MKFDFDVGTVVAVNTAANPPSIQVKLMKAGGSVAIPLSAAAWEQTVPIVGYRVFVVQFDTFQYRILKFWGNDEDFTRKGPYALNDGEVFIQSPSGLGYLKIDQDGRVQIIGGDMTASLEHGDSGTIIKSPIITLVSVGNAFVELTEAGEISLRQEDSDGNVKAFLSFDAKNNIMFKTSADVSIVATNIYLDGKVWHGPGATDPATREKFSPVVTGAPIGTLPTDLTTGAPIPGSKTVMAAS